MPKVDDETGEVFELGIDGRHDQDGRERLNPEPSHIPVKVRRTDALTEQMRRVIREEMSRAAELQGMETFEESNDFQVDDEYDPTSPHEIAVDDELDGFKSFKKRVQEAAADLVRGRQSAPPPPPPVTQPAPPDPPKAE